jgi:hypothetical protein
LEAATLSGAILPTNAPPTVAVFSPTNGATFTAPAEITITAKPSDSDGTISLVEFFQNDTYLGAVTNSPYDFNWTNVAAGNYTLTARAADNFGATAISSPVLISVTNASATPVVILNPSINDGAFHFSFATQSGPNYTVQFTDSLEPVNWQVITNFIGDGTMFGVTNSTTTTERFYRVGVQ